MWTTLDIFYILYLSANGTAAVVQLGSLLGLTGKLSTILSSFILTQLHKCRFGDADLPIDDIAAACLLVTNNINQYSDNKEIHFPSCTFEICLDLNYNFISGNTDWPQVYFGVSTLLDASSGDSLKAEEEQKEVEILLIE